MSGYLSLIEFVPGTKAKAQEVNQNFQTISENLTEKADKAGSSSQVFNVSNATVSTHAINKAQLDAVSTELNSKINEAFSRFCVKSGNITNDIGDLLNYSGMNVSFKAGGTYPNLTVSNAKGTFATFTSIETLNMNGKPNGVHNIFIPINGNPYSLSNNIYKQPARPSLLEGDVWLNTGVEPLKAIKYVNGSDTEFLDIPLGNVTISGGTISAITTFPYNQNDYDVTLNSTIKPASILAKSITNSVMPDYSNPVSKAWGIDHTAECDGCLYVEVADDVNVSHFLHINNLYLFTLGHGGYDDNIFGTFVPMPKNIIYKATGGSKMWKILFYPLKGAI